MRDFGGDPTEEAVDEDDIGNVDYGSESDNGEFDMEEEYLKEPLSEEDADFPELTIPQELAEKFSQLYAPQTFAQRKELLTWFVDNLRVELLQFFENQEAFDHMGA
mmetsp:Transcript_21844/g.33833  ORF Transcript_21844/g.33833 Transcript_21844/m.33833 type:complete len:106 (+) Transcript_21844:2274-2591(+)